MSRSVPGGSAGRGMRGPGQPHRRPGLGHVRPLGQRPAGQRAHPGGRHRDAADGQETAAARPGRRLHDARRPGPGPARRRADRVPARIGGPGLLRLPGRNPVPPVAAGRPGLFPGPCVTGVVRAHVVAGLAGRSIVVRVPGAWGAGQRGIVGNLESRYVQPGRPRRPGSGGHPPRHHGGRLDQLGQRERGGRGADQSGQRVPGGRVRLGQRGGQADQREHGQPGVAVGQPAHGQYPDQPGEDREEHQDANDQGQFVVRPERRDGEVLDLGRSIVYGHAAHGSDRRALGLEDSGYQLGYAERDSSGDQAGHQAPAGASGTVACWHRGLRVGGGAHRDYS